MSISTGRWWQLYVSARTDKRGRFRIDLIPGVKYFINGQSQPLSVKPGESKDLGDTKIEGDGRDDATENQNLGTLPKSINK